MVTLVDGRVLKRRLIGNCRTTDAVIKIDADNWRR